LDEGALTAATAVVGCRRMVTSSRSKVTVMMRGGLPRVGRL
jgi:hypothetical protein